MNPPEEKLTRKQFYACAGAMAVTFMAFSSVFAYAYIKGAQVRVKNEQAQAAHISLCESAADGSLQKKASRIVQGHRGQANNIQYREAAKASPYWTISKLPSANPGGPQPATPIIAYSTSPREWAIYPTGVVQVPPQAEPGLYTLQCSAGEYLFEVVPGRGTPPKRPLLRTVPTRKAATSRPLHVTSDLIPPTSSSLQDAEDW